MSMAHWFKNTYWSCRDVKQKSPQSIRKLDCFCKRSMTKPTERHFWFSSYLCLHHQWAVHSQVMDNAIHVYNVLPLYLEYQTVNGYEGTRASDSSTEWTNNRQEPSQIHVALCLKQLWRHVIRGGRVVCVCVFWETCSEPRWESVWSTGPCVLWPDVWSRWGALWFLAPRDPARLWSGTDALNGSLPFLPEGRTGSQIRFNWERDWVLEQKM